MSRLTKEEINDIAIEYINLRTISEETNDIEDIKKFKAYQNYCANRLKPLVLRHVAKYKKFSNYPDLQQDGFEALLMSLNTFNPNKGIFGYWAKQYIKTRVCRSANAHSTIRIPIKKAKEMRPYKISTIPIQIDTNPTPSETFETSEKSSNIYDAIDLLSDAQQDVINMTYGFNGNRENTAGKVMDRLSLTRPQYTKLLYAARDNIRKHLSKLDK